MTFAANFGMLCLKSTCLLYPDFLDIVPIAFSDMMALLEDDLAAPSDPEAAAAVQLPSSSIRVVELVSEQHGGGALSLVQLCFCCLSSILVRFRHQSSRLPRHSSLTCIVGPRASWTSPTRWSSTGQLAGQRRSAASRQQTTLPASSTVLAMVSTCCRFAALCCSILVCCLLAASQTGICGNGSTDFLCYKPRIAAAICWCLVQ